MRPLPTPTTGQHPYPARPGLRDLRPEEDRGLQCVRTNQTLHAVDRPTTVLNWLKRPTVATALAELATGQRPLSHAALDDLPGGKPVEHLRSVLVATAALPARDEQLARIQRWVAQTVVERDP